MAEYGPKEENAEQARTIAGLGKKATNLAGHNKAVSKIEERILVDSAEHRAFVDQIPDSAWVLVRATGGKALEVHKTGAENAEKYLLTEFSGNRVKNDVPDSILKIVHKQAREFFVELDADNSEGEYRVAHYDTEDY